MRKLCWFIAALVLMGIVPIALKEIETSKGKLCSHRLKHLWILIDLHKEKSESKILPPSLGDLWTVFPEEKEEFGSCPKSGAPYAYRPPMGQAASSLRPSNTPVAWCPENHRWNDIVDARIVLFLDGHVEALPADKFSKLDLDR